MAEFLITMCVDFASKCTKMRLAAGQRKADNCALYLLSLAHIQVILVPSHIQSFWLPNEYSIEKANFIFLWLTFTWCLYSHLFTRSSVYTTSTFSVKHKHLSTAMLIIMFNRTVSYKQGCICQISSGESEFWVFTSGSMPLSGTSTW